MNAAERIPTGEQYDDAQAFVIDCLRRNSSRLASCEADIIAAFHAWSQVMQKNLARTELAMKSGDFERAVHSWAVVLDGISLWVARSDFPPSLYADAYAARYGG